MNSISNYNIDGTLRITYVILVMKEIFLDLVEKKQIPFVYNISVAT